MVISVEKCWCNVVVGIILGCFNFNETLHIASNFLHAKDSSSFIHFVLGRGLSCPPIHRWASSILLISHFGRSAKLYLLIKSEKKTNSSQSNNTPPKMEAFSQTILIILHINNYRDVQGIAIDILISHVNWWTPQRRKFETHVGTEVLWHCSWHCSWSDWVVFRLYWAEWNFE
jgi:hypothetical protein